MNPSRKWDLWDSTTFIKICTRPFLYVWPGNKFFGVFLWYQPHPTTPGDLDISGKKKIIYSSYPLLGKRIKGVSVPTTTKHSTAFQKQPQCTNGLRKIANKQVLSLWCPTESLFWWLTLPQLLTMLWKTQKSIIQHFLLSSNF